MRDHTSSHFLISKLDFRLGALLSDETATNSDTKELVGVQSNAGRALEKRVVCHVEAGRQQQQR